jgi:hypothetical protein
MSDLRKIESAGQKQEQEGDVDPVQAIIGMLQDHGVAMLPALKAVLTWVGQEVSCEDCFQVGSLQEIRLGELEEDESDNVYLVITAKAIF